MTAPFSDSKIIESWHGNAIPWCRAVRENQIESRVLVTNQAIIDTVIDAAPKTLLDIGCGEGWLARALESRNIRVLGLDAVAELVTQAQQAGGGLFLRMSYEQLANGQLKETFDAVVCNFSLLGEASVDALFKVMPEILNPGGYFIIQTLHPVTCCGEADYVDGWREGSWQGFSQEFNNPAPWYFRTLESWFKLFRENRMQLERVKEPVHPETGDTLSIIMVGRVAA